MPIPTSSEFFTGRGNYIEQLKTYFSPRNVLESGTRRSFLLYGLGGEGKTQICLKFLEENPNL